MARPTTSLQRKLDINGFQRAAQTREIETLVFLAGPFIEPDDEAKSSTSDAAILRFKLYHALTNSGFIVSLGEYKELIDSFRGELGEYHNAAIAEVAHAQQAATIVVMIPDSPGSFAEFGAFSMKPDICEKMIILNSLVHESSEGYINTGPVVLAKALRAELHYVDYTDHISCLSLIESFAGRIKSRNLIKHWVRS